MEKPTSPSPLTLCHSALPDRFQALVNGKPFLPQTVDALSCLQTELEGARNRKIWKIHAVGKVAYRRTVFGLFLDPSLEPGTYDLVRDDRLTVIYHLTPKQSAQVYHSQDFQEGSLTLLECNGAKGRLRGSFEFAIPAVGFAVSCGEFDVLCRPEKPASTCQKSGDTLGRLL
ncbi:hypothetical protein [Pseudomonas sp. NPDC088444]|uniref:hypothetical protein n=1 Tax=Pseudomonas sp. NPDC088444 TaxID=3364456 RepID=UPI003851531C